MAEGIFKGVKIMEKELWEECIIVLEDKGDKVLLFKNEGSGPVLPKVRVPPVRPGFFVDKETAGQMTEEKIRKNIRNYLSRHGIYFEPYKLNELAKKPDWIVRGSSATRERVYQLNSGDYRIDFIMSFGLTRRDKGDVYKKLKINP